MASWPAGGGARTALVTGAGNGIGAATAQALADRGWNVALVDLDLEAAAARAERIGERAAAFQANITDQASVDAAVAGAVERFGGLDLCFANAGIAAEGTLRHTDPEVFAAQVDVNLVGTFRTIHACLPHLLASRGYLLINSSASALMAPPGLGAYGSTKAAVESLGDTLRREVRHHGVDVGVVYLLWVQTDLVEGAEAQSQIFRTVRASFTGPLARAMPVERATEAIVRGIERRSRRVTAPGVIGALYRLRGVAPALLERDSLKMAPDVEAATEREIAAKGAVDAALRQDTPATAAAAAGVSRDD
jgi:NAD(P)-dependent dehydrogenase (short-subunit alcohol dehydrogenase family)